MRPLVLAISVAACVVVAGGLLAPPALAQQAKPAPIVPDPVRGEKLYTTRCTACHSIDANRIGPKHRGLVGRKSASISDFRYTAALKKLSVVWNPANLDRWLENPIRMAPGTAMVTRTALPQDRADIIAYLASQK